MSTLVKKEAQLASLIEAKKPLYEEFKGLCVKSWKMGKVSYSYTKADFIKKDSENGAKNFKAYAPKAEALKKMKEEIEALEVEIKAEKPKGLPFGGKSVAVKKYTYPKKGEPGYVAEWGEAEDKDGKLDNTIAKKYRTKFRDEAKKGEKATSKVAAEEAPKKKKSSKVEPEPAPVVETPKKPKSKVKAAKNVVVEDED